MQQMHPYLIKRNRKSRSVKISITPEGEVIVTAPPLVPEFFIRNVVEKSEVWISRNVSKIQRTKARMHEQGDILFLGQPMKIEMIFDHGKSGVEIDGNTLKVYQVLKTDESSKKQLVRWYKSTAETYITKEVHLLAKRMNVSFERVLFRDQKTRWGSCSSTGTLSFNWKLIQAPIEVMRYVVIHELSHITHMNHSSEFWKRVSEFDPEYKEHRAWLKKQSVLLHSTILS